MFTQLYSYLDDVIRKRMLSILIYSYRTGKVTLDTYGSSSAYLQLTKEERKKNRSNTNVTICVEEKYEKEKSFGIFETINGKLDS